MPNIRQYSSWGEDKERSLSASIDAVPTAAGGKAFLASELPAVMDLFSDFAGDVDDDGKQVLGLDGMKNLLDSVGERPSEDDLAALFEAADADGNGTVDLDEFLHAADAFLGTHPARCCLVVGGPGSGKGVLCDRLVAECNVAHVSSGDMLREEVAAGTPLGKECAAIMERGDLVPSSTITTLLRRHVLARFTCARFVNYC